jgi:hypothetical protein
MTDENSSTSHDHKREKGMNYNGILGGLYGMAFIGYSFPFSDADMMFSSARALSENAGLRKVYLVDPEAEAIAARLRNPTSKIGPHFRNLLHPIARGWTDVALPL